MSSDNLLSIDWSHHPGYLLIFVGGLMVVIAALKKRRKNLAEAERLKKLMRDRENKKPVV